MAFLANNLAKRDKRAVYVWDKKWPIKAEEKQAGIEFYILKTGQRIDVERIGKIDEVYQGEDVIVAKDRGYDLNFNINSRVTLIGLINLLRENMAPFVLDKDGMPIFGKGGETLPNKNPLPEPYDVPVVIYRDRFGLFEKSIRGFKKIKRVSIIKDNNEISFCIDKKYKKLIGSPTFLELKNKLRREFSEIEVFGNNLFVNHINHAI